LLTENQILILFVCFASGAVLRTLWGYLWKWLEAGELEWDRRYIASMIVSIIITFIFALITFSSQQLPNYWEPMHAFSYISIGFTINTLFNSVVSYQIKKEYR